MKGLNKQFSIFCCILFVGFLLHSCVGMRNTPLKKQLIESNCNQQNIYSYRKIDLPIAIYPNQLDTLLSTKFSFKSLNVANAIGIDEDIAKYVHQLDTYKLAPSLDRRIELIERLQKINQRVNVASLEISAVAAEMDCEEERAAQIAVYLKRKEDEAETKFTVGSIIIGAVGAVTAGVLLANGNDDNLPEIIGIGAGLAEASLGLMILTNKRKVEFHHTRNALKDIWEGQDSSTIFPAPVWYYLNYYDSNNVEQPSFRYQIIDRWMNFGQISVAKRKRKRDLIDVYFGLGGKYTSEQLFNRANMLDELEAYINLMKQDLKGLALELENLNQ